MPWITWRVPTPFAWATTTYYVTLVAWLTRRLWLTPIRPSRRRAALALPITTAVTGAWIVAGPPMMWAAHAGALTVVSLDVGQGDSTLVRFPGGGSLLVDAGGLGGGTRFDIGERVVAPAAWPFGVRRLQAFVATHGDVDHIGGPGSARSWAATHRGRRLSTLAMTLAVWGARAAERARFTME